jgi:predicted permease
VIGRVVRLNGLPYEIIGVLADDRGDLRYRWGEEPAGIFLPLFAAEQLTRFDLDGDRGLRVLNALLRLHPETSLESARRDFGRLSNELAREHPQSNEGWSYNLQPLDDAFFEDLQGPTRILVAGSILVFLLIAVNLVSLVLIRTAGRRREMAMRRALGARGGRVTRQLITECLVLAAVGGGLGLLVAFWGVSAVTSSGLLDLPDFSSVRLEGWILAASAAAVVAAGVVLGVGAALVTRGASVSAGSHRSSPSRSGQRLRRTLVAVEVALAFTLLVGAGLVLSSFWELRGTGYGFDTDDLLLARIDLRGDTYAPDRLRAVADELRTAGAALPGVRESFIWSPNRLGHGNQVEILTAEGRFADNPEERLEASLHTLHPGTLTKLGIPLLAGRDVSTTDVAGGARVALISERLAADLWPGESPIGRRFETVHDGEIVHVEVIGVTADARHRTRLIDPFGPQRDVYYPFAQAPWRTMTLALRTDPGIDVGPLAASVRRLVRELDAGLPVYDVATMSENLRREEASARLSAGLVLLYAALAVALAALGLYGMLAHSVRARRREIGVRLALGADARTVLATTLRSGLAPVALGALGGLAVSLAAGRVLVRTLYGVSAYDPLTYTAAPLLLAGIALAALYLPARRAARTDPVDALRAE